MTFLRRSCVALAAGCFLIGSASAQEGAGAAAAGGSAPATGASSAFGPPPSGASGTGPGGGSASGPNTPGAGPAVPPSGTTQGTAPNGGSQVSGTGTGTGTATGAASAFGENQTGQKTPASSEPTYTVPAAYGSQPQTFTAGEGRLARPKFRYTGTVSFGYDDNVLSAPTNPAGTPDQVVVVLDQPGTPAHTETGIGASGQPVTVTVPGRAATTKTVVIRGTQGQKRAGSFLTRENVGVDIQFASRKTLFTFDLSGGTDIYWDRPNTSNVDYHGSLAMLYLRRLTSRLQFTANVNAIYQTQPDLTLVNSPTTQQSGPFLNFGGKADLSYRFTPRLSSVTSVSYNALRYESSASQNLNYQSETFGEEVRYLFSPRFTLLGEARYSLTDYSSVSAQNSTSYFLLLGGELAVSRIFAATLRVGMQEKSFTESGASSTSPYGEATLKYQLAKATLIQFNGRYGFENPPDANSKVISLRTGLNLVQSFSPRLRGTLGANLVSQTTTSSLTGAKTKENTVNSTIGFEYNLDRHWTLFANYTYITAIYTIQQQNYYRNQTFLGASYEF